ncbi:MAG: hypothetical protein ACM3UX_00825, partial [Candidatus Woesearchaeota archaeon]
FGRMLQSFEFLEPLAQHLRPYVSPWGVAGKYGGKPAIWVNTTSHRGNPEELDYTVQHELGHTSNAATNGLNHEDLTPEQYDAVRQVSRYGTKNRAEMMAEIMAKGGEGEEVPPVALDEYRKLGGGEIRPLAAKVYRPTPLEWAAIRRSAGGR